jgi:hypothetical protein
MILPSWAIPVSVGVLGCVFAYGCWFLWNTLGIRKVYVLLTKSRDVRRGVVCFEKVAGKLGDDRVDAILNDDFLVNQSPFMIGLIEERYYKLEAKKNGKRGKNTGNVGKQKEDFGTGGVSEEAGTVGVVDAQRVNIQDKLVGEVRSSESDSDKDVGVEEGTERHINRFD